MSFDVRLETLGPKIIAAVRVQVPIGGVAQAWKPALDRVWTFLRAHPEIEPGHNLFLYHHPVRRGDPMDVDFGVEVAEPFADDGTVRCVRTPAGSTATTLLVGPYARMPAAHDAIHAWCAANSKQIGSQSWELYGDWTDDESRLETAIYYLLR